MENMPHRTRNMCRGLWPEEARHAGGIKRPVWLGWRKKWSVVQDGAEARSCNVGSLECLFLLNAPVLRSQSVWDRIPVLSLACYKPEVSSLIFLCLNFLIYEMG